MQPHELPESEFYDPADSHADLEDRQEIDKELTDQEEYDRYEFSIINRDNNQRNE